MVVNMEATSKGFFKLSCEGKLLVKYVCLL